MPPPSIDAQTLRALLPAIEEIGRPLPPSGQKLVFPCRIGGRRFALKVLRCHQQAADAALAETQPLDEVYARAKREVAILSVCTGVNLPRIGPIPLTELDHGTERLVAFSEEFIDGKNLDEVLASTGPLSEAETVRLAHDVSTAIAELWRQRKIHRDVKPGNIMRRDADGSFVLLDPGIAFDQLDQSLTAYGVINHTPGFLAPEHANVGAKRDADVRADLFLLGIVLYCALTGAHPFIERWSQPVPELIRNILTKVPPEP